MAIDRDFSSKYLTKLKSLKETIETQYVTFKCDEEIDKYDRLAFICKLAVLYENSILKIGISSYDERKTWFVFLKLRTKKQICISGITLLDSRMVFNGVVENSFIKINNNSKTILVFLLNVLNGEDNEYTLSLNNSINGLKKCNEYLATNEKHSYPKDISELFNKMGIVLKNI